MDITDHKVIQEEFALQEQDIQKREQQAEQAYESSRDKIAYAQACSDLALESRKEQFRKTCVYHDWWRHGDPDGVRADATKLNFRGIDVGGMDFHDWKHVDQINLAGAKNINRAYGLMYEQAFKTIRNQIKENDRKHQPERRKNYAKHSRSDLL